MKKTALYEKHIELNAKMVPFAGFEMPVQYKGLKFEHQAVRERIGIFDVSHMGEFWVEGEKAFEFVQWLTSNDVSQLSYGKVQYSCFPNGKGGIVDDLLVYDFGGKYLLVVNASNIEKDWNWVLEQNKKFSLKVGTELINASDEWSQLAVQGPLALKAMQKLTDELIEDMTFYTFKDITFAGIKNVCFSTTGYTGSGGCEIYIKNKDAHKVWEAVMNAGEEYGIEAAGLGARDTLRLEMGYCLYGNDINDTTSPLEAGLGWITKLNSEDDFVDKQFLIQQKEEGLNRRLKAFELIEKGIPRHDYEIVNAEGENIGIVTSGTMSPSLNIGIGMGYLNKGYTKLGTNIYIKIRKKVVKAVVVKTPFYKG